jgi:hypothetical protein
MLKVVSALVLIVCCTSILYAATPLTIHYGHVVGIEVTNKESAMARNMLIGSLVGWAVKGNSSGAISGAVAGFAITSLVENDKRVFAYTGGHVNLRPVSAVHCDDDSMTNDADKPGGEHRLTAAQKCSAARKTLTTGEPDADIQTALRSMRAYCD